MFAVGSVHCAVSFQNYLNRFLIKKERKGKKGKKRG
jgi:hypothetical protein